MKIGIVGSGQIGGLIRKLWSQAGHEVLFSSRHPQEVGGLVEQAGDGARAGTPEEAIAFGDAVLLSVPFATLPDFGRRSQPCAPVKGRLARMPSRKAALVNDATYHG
jgi:predicted dinucleotide-binding enzyme